MPQHWAEQFYLSNSWKQCRASFLQSKQYLCERCSTQHDPVVASIVHHRIYITQENIIDPNITLSWNNLEALCPDCHNREHHAAERKPRYAFDNNGELVPVDY